MTEMPSSISVLEDVRKSLEVYAEARLALEAQLMILKNEKFCPDYLVLVQDALNPVTASVTSEEILEDEPQIKCFTEGEEDSDSGYVADFSRSQSPSPSPSFQQVSVKIEESYALPSRLPPTIQPTMQTTTTGSSPAVLGNLWSRHGSPRVMFSEIPDVQVHRKRKRAWSGDDDISVSSFTSAKCETDHSSRRPRKRTIVKTPLAPPELLCGVSNRISTRLTSTPRRSNRLASRV